jgi:hypothetical protein
VRHVGRDRVLGSADERWFAVGEGGGRVEESEALAHSSEEVCRFQPDQPSTFGARVHPDPVTGIEHTAYMSIHADGDSSGPLGPAEVARFGLAATRCQSRAGPMRLASFEESQDGQHPSMRGVGLG